jgi:hypothetical protein
MKQNPVHLAADISKALAADPYQSNWDLARHFDVSEGVIRRQRAILERAGLLPIVDSRRGSDGIVRSLPSQV